MTELDFKLLLLIIAANAAPILANHIARALPAPRIDAGLDFFDGRPLLGSSKTWRGVLASVCLALLVGAALQLPLMLAAGVALLAMLGDLLSSFVKRRMALAPSDRALLLDQIPESLLPALFAQQFLGLPAASVVWLVFLFIVFELGLSPMAYRLRIRKRPY